MPLGFYNGDIVQIIIHGIFNFKREERLTNGLSSHINKFRIGQLKLIKSRRILLYEEDVRIYRQMTLYLNQ